MIEKKWNWVPTNWIQFSGSSSIIVENEGQGRSYGKQCPTSSFWVKIINITLLNCTKRFLYKKSVMFVKCLAHTTLCLLAISVHTFIAVMRLTTSRSRYRMVCGRTITFWPIWPHSWNRSKLNHFHMQKYILPWWNLFFQHHSKISSTDNQNAFHWFTLCSGIELRRRKMI